VGLYGEWREVSRTYVDIADRWNIGHINIDRPLFASNVSKIGFDADGFVTSVALQRESEGLAASRIPLDVLNAILSVPANFMDRAFGSFNERLKLLTERSQLLEPIAKQPPKGEQPTTEENFKLECVKVGSS
jgi:hypothetical protein